MTRAKNLTQHLERLGPFDPAAMTLREARAIKRRFYVDGLGYASSPALLTLPESQYKLGKSERRAVGLTLAPADMSGEWDACTWRTAQCTAACVLATAGKGVFETVREGRRNKTRFLADHPQAFVTLLDAELRAQVARYGPIDFRPNIASDVRWERIAPLLLEIPQVRVYDYTKAPAAHREQSPNYRLVFSVSERGASVEQALDYLRAGGTTAVVFDTKRGHDLPATWQGFDVIDADTSDSRFDDPSGVVVGLRAKGSARGVVGADDGFVKPGVAS